ncbi:MAG: glycosyltransferase family 39 protein, partial [Planctomycetia bacterium]|nr:glycosyltransferase family 39 protein [Planctomycetia bacterium]
MSAEASSLRETPIVQPDTRREDRLFWCFAILFFAAWIIVPTLFFGNYRPDVIEQSFVGQEWVFGTAKHPSLTAIVLEVVSLGTLRASFAPYFVSQLFVLVTMISIWCLAKDIMSKPLALAATCAMFNYWFFHFESTLYNNNITLNASWAVSTVLCWYAFKTNKLFYWIFAGLAIGIGLHFKYTMAMFAILMVLFLLCDSQGRKYWTKPGPWLTTLTAFLVFLPHLIWVIQHDYITLQYASNLIQKPGWTGHVTEPLDFVAGQLVYIIPLLIPLIPICGWIGRIDRSKFCKTFQERYLLIIWAAPFLFQL